MDVGNKGRGPMVVDGRWKTRACLHPTLHLARTSRLQRSRNFVSAQQWTTSASDQGRSFPSRGPSRRSPRASPGGHCHRQAGGAGDPRIRPTDAPREPRGRGFLVTGPCRPAFHAFFTSMASAFHSTWPALQRHEGRSRLRSKRSGTMRKAAVRNRGVARECHPNTGQSREQGTTLPSCYTGAPGDGCPSTDRRPLALHAGPAARRQRAASELCPHSTGPHAHPRGRR